MSIGRAVVIAAAADEPGLRRAYAAGIARGASNTQCSAEDERMYGTLRLLTLATLRLPDLFLYAHIVEVLASDRDHLPPVAVNAITAPAAGALRLAHRALETHARRRLRGRRVGRSGARARGRAALRRGRCAGAGAARPCSAGGDRADPRDCRDGG
jgi:hypothetical protein